MMTTICCSRDVGEAQYIVFVRITQMAEEMEFERPRARSAEFTGNLVARWAELDEEYADRLHALKASLGWQTQMPQRLEGESDDDLDTLEP